MTEAERPTGEPERKERWGVATKGIPPAVTAARQHVGITEEVFRTQTFHGFPRAFFLWTALDEIFKASIFLMRLDDFLDEEPARQRSQDADPVGRTIEAILLEEVRLRQRRLCELHVLLVLFAQKNAPELYKHLLLLQEAVAASAFNKDLSEFHGAASEWVAKTVEITLGDIHAVEPSVAAADASWYVRDYSRPLRASDLKPVGLLTNARDRIKSAFPLMTEFERLSVGTTYHEAFAAPSESIHYRAGADPVDHSKKSSVTAEGTKLSFVALSALRRVMQLLMDPGHPRLEAISRGLETNATAVKYFKALSRPEIVVGDFVSARGHLGQVTDERVEATYGNRSLRVELLDRRPMPDLAVVWFRAREVLPFLSKENLVARVRERLGEHAAAVDDEILRAAALDTWRLREEVLVQRTPTPWAP